MTAILTNGPAISRQCPRCSRKFSYLDSRILDHRERRIRHRSLCGNRRGQGSFERGARSRCDGHNPLHIMELEASRIGRMLNGAAPCRRRQRWGLPSTAGAKWGVHWSPPTPKPFFPSGSVSVAAPTLDDSNAANHWPSRSWELFLVVKEGGFFDYAWADLLTRPSISGGFRRLQTMVGVVPCR